MAGRIDRAVWTAVHVRARLLVTVPAAVPQHALAGRRDEGHIGRVPSLASDNVDMPLAPTFRLRRLAAALLLAPLAPVLPAPLASVLSAQEGDGNFAYSEQMIPTRDGVKLYTRIYAPKNASEKLPIMLLRTPYGVGGWNGSRIAIVYKELADDGYIFVFQDNRGRFKSEGKFVMMRQPRDPKDKNGIDESTDTYDSIEWLLKNVPNNNGKVGMMGVSYGGWLTAMGMLDPHPALAAVSPQASPADMWMGDDFHHNGAFRLSYGFEYAYMMESSKEITDARGAITTFDSYDWYLKQGALSNITKNVVKGGLPTWKDFATHPDYDAFWQRQGFAPWLNKVTVPTLNVAGWWDQEDFYGPIKIYDLLEKHDTKNQNFLVVGPWNHGGWTFGPGDHLGKIKFGQATAEYYRKNIQAPFFAYYLKGTGKLDLPEALVFRTGDNAWVRLDSWPPKRNMVEKHLMLGGDGKLTIASASGVAEASKGGANEPQFSEYVSDPKKPVPYRARPIETTYDPKGSTWSTWLLDDQRFVDGRPDVMTWTSDVLTEDLVASGQVIGKLVAATSGTDADWVVKLIDVYPDSVPDDPRMGGYQLMVANDVLRGRYRKSFEKPEAIPANVSQDYTVDMHNMDHTFKKGHRIMVQVQSSWFPIIDRNPQKFVPNIFSAKDSDFQRAVQRIYKSSYVKVSVLEPIRQ